MASSDGCIVAGYRFKLEASVTSVYLYSKQVLIQNGADFFQIIPLNSTFPQSVINALFEDESYQYQIKADRNKLIKAADISILNGKDKLEQLVSRVQIKEAAISISSLHGSNITKIAAEEGRGNMEIYINAFHLKDALRHIDDDTAVISGSGTKPSLYTGLQHYGEDTCPPY